MLKCFLTIILAVSTSAVIGQPTLAYQYNAIQYLVDEKETSDDKPTNKETKEDLKEKYISFNNLHLRSFVQHVRHFAFDKIIRHSKEALKKPYIPPEAVI